MVPFCRMIDAGLGWVFNTLLALAVLAFSALWWSRALGQVPMRPSDAPTTLGEPTIIDRPLPFGSHRQMLTLNYIRAHYDPSATSIVIEPQMVVIHWTGSAHIASALATFKPDNLPLWRLDIRRGGKVNVSAHFLVDRDGTIYRLMPETWMARHVIGLNTVSLGIENVGGPTNPLTKMQLQSNAVLVRYLVRQHPQLRFLIGHHEYGRFRDSALWRERDPTYFTNKQDPGDEFMQHLRASIANLGLTSTPPHR